MTTGTTDLLSRERAPAAEPVDPVVALADRLFNATVGAMDLLCIGIGSSLGLYEAVRRSGPITAARLAEQEELDERYVAEWLAQQAITGLLEAVGQDEARRQYLLSPGVAEVLLNRDSLAYLAPLSELTSIVHRMRPRIEQAIRTGEGVPYKDYGDAAVSIQEELNRPAFLTQLVAEWLPAMPDVLERLADDRQPARVLDIGCGAGWSAIAMAEAFPHLVVVGLDSDAVSVQHARRNAVDRGLEDRVSFLERYGEERPVGEPFHLVTLFECLHDMAHPLEVLRVAHEALAPDGTVLLMDERAAETFTAPADEVERFLAAASVLWCLPQSRVEADSAALGTCLRPATVVRLAGEAGFSRIDVLPIEHPFWRFYRLTP